MPELVSQPVEPPLTLHLRNRVYILRSAVIFQRYKAHYLTYVRDDVSKADSDWIICDDSLVSSTSYLDIQNSIRLGTLYVYINQEKITEVLN
jgi:hypothetical protein